MASLVESKATVVVVSVMLLYFLWMDIALFYHVNNQHRTSQDTASSQPTGPPHRLISPFVGLSVKMMMMDPVNNYIFTPAAQIFNEVSGFSHTFSFITPNMVSFVGILFAMGAAKCMSVDARLCHCLAILLFQMRTFCDALDGIVARARIGMVQFVSLRNTSGYVVDGVADALGFTAFLIGCFQYLRVVVPKSYLPLNTTESCKENSPQHSNNTQKRVFYIITCFGLQMAAGAFFWDHYINAYHNLLETHVSSPQQTEAQNEVLRSSITWILMWFWRLSNAHTFIQFLLFAIYLNKLWEFLTWMQYVGFAQIFLLAFCTEIHLSTVRSYVIGFG